MSNVPSFIGFCVCAVFLQLSSAAAGDDSGPNRWGGLYAGFSAGAGLGAVGNGNGISRSGAIVGVQLGYSIQSNAIVYGIEAEADVSFLRSVRNIQSSAIRESNLVIVSPDGTILPDKFEYRIYSTHKVNDRALGMVRVRFGYTFNNFLLYGTGGVALLRQQVSGTTTSVGGPSPYYFYYSISDWLRGCAIGLGAEYAFTQNVSLKFEYLRVGLNNTIFIDTYRDRINIIRTGVNYRF